jgi:hypothetical protein
LKTMPAVQRAGARRATDVERLPCSQGDMPRKPSRGGPVQGGCPWAQDSDTDPFARGPPSSRGGRGGAKGYAGPPVQPPRTAYKPQGSGGAPWASDEPSVWEKPVNGYGAGLNIGGGAPAPSAYDMDPYAEPLPDDGEYGYGAPSMPMPKAHGRGGGGGAPWALEQSEPMMSVSQAAYRGGLASRGGAPPSRGGPTLSAKDMKAKMQGAGNLLSWN